MPPPNPSLPTWTDYLSGQTLTGYLDFLAFHAPLVEAAVAVQPQRAIEIGCGGANLAIFFSHLGIQSVGLDLERGVINEAVRHATALRSPARFIQGDGFATPFPDNAFDVSVSQGVLEHFSDEQIEAFLAESIRISRRTIASVPNNNYPSRDFGNERLLPASFWLERAQAAARRIAPNATVTATDYRRRTNLRHPLNTITNLIARRGFFTLLIIDRP